MKKVKRALGLVVLIVVISTVCPAAGSQQKTEPNRPSVGELFNKFTQSRQNMNSFVINGKATITFNILMSKKDNWNGKRFTKFSDKFDGNRNKASKFDWGIRIDPMTPNLAEKDAQYASYLWDGENTYSYTQGKPSNPGYAFIVRKNDMKNTVFNDTDFIKNDYSGQVMGYAWGDDERIDELWKSNPGQFKLREKLENIRDSNCYVIDADIKGRGKYTIWIDPAHDYYIAKISVQRRGNDSVGTNKLKKGDYYNVTFEILQYKKVGDRWFPKECRIKHESDAYGNHSNEETIIQFTDVVFNPDHKALKSFSTDDIANGSEVQFPALPTKLKFVWQDGKVIDNKGIVFMDLMEKNK